VSATLVAGQTLTTDTEGNGATATDPFETAVTTPNAGFASISESTTSIAADAFSFLGWQVQISAPAATTASPLVLVFRLDASIVPAGKLYVFRNGVALTDCPGDPCVSQRSTLTDGDAELVARTSSASQWTFARAILSRGAAAGTFTTSNGISVALTAGCDGTTLAGSLNAGNYRARQMTAFSVSGKKAWLAGVGMDGRTFIAYMEDNAPGGRGDVFKLWIGGVAQTTDGAIKKGDLTVRSL
jgi:hypothetical protein